jgi:hypothetical protein
MSVNVLLSQACWSADGSQIYAGRRNGTVDVWDVRLLGRSGPLETPRLLKTLRNPTSSGVVSCVVAFPDCRHIAWLVPFHHSFKPSLWRFLFLSSPRSVLPDFFFSWSLAQGAYVSIISVHRLIIYGCGTWPKPKSRILGERKVGCSSRSYLVIMEDMSLKCVSIFFSSEYLQF